MTKKIQNTLPKSIIKSTSCYFDILSTSDPKLLHYRSWWDAIITQTHVWYKAEGNHGIKRMKNILSILQSLALGESFTPLPFTKSDSNGVPKLLSPILPYLASIGMNDKGVRTMTIVLSLTRATDFFLSQPKDSDVVKQLTTIRTSKSQFVDQMIDGTGKFSGKSYLEFLDEFEKTYPDSAVIKQLHRSLTFAGLTEGVYDKSTRGPNGPLLESCMKDIKAFNAEPNLDLKNSITLLETAVIACSNTRIFRPDSVFQRSKDTDINLKSVGKITILPEKSGKIRLIAQPDYFSQRALKPVHDWLMSAVKAFPHDCTHNQRKLNSLFETWTDSGCYLASFDHSSCTDLFPVDLQVQVLTKFKTTLLSESVKTVLTDRDFDLKLPSGATEKVRWSSGQPMGALASWPLMALSHHFLVHYAYWVSHNKQLPKKMFDLYAILGDDIVIADRHVADAYVSICRDLGMKINLTKSHVSQGTSEDPGSHLEFAKVIVWKGRVIQTLKPQLVAKATKDWRLSIPLLLDIKNNSGLKLKISLATKLIDKYFSKGRKILPYLIQVPEYLGGLGFRGNLDHLTGSSSIDGLTPMFWYIAIRYSKMSKLRAKGYSHNSQYLSENYQIRTLTNFRRSRDRRSIHKSVSPLKSAQFFINGTIAWAELVTEHMSSLDYSWSQKEIKRNASLWMDAYKLHLKYPKIKSYRFNFGSVTQSGYVGSRYMNVVNTPAKVVTAFLLNVDVKGDGGYSYLNW